MSCLQAWMPPMFVIAFLSKFSYFDHSSGCEGMSEARCDDITEASCDDFVDAMCDDSAGPNEPSELDDSEEEAETKAGARAERDTKEAGEAEEEEE
mmetsp:Transcript_78392/g.217733  ORF Transcript_78392/g.217733 Transcript_78392/m.217733 type:complete len:96 (-) Transcript_78392:6-293(-)